MQISSRFTLAIHIFACIDTFQHAYKVTSDFLASSTNVNPVIIRKILGQLKAAGLVEVARGCGGTSIAKPLQEISFLDIYQAVACVEHGELFHFMKSQSGLPGRQKYPHGAGWQAAAGAAGYGRGTCGDNVGGCYEGCQEIYRSGIICNGFMIVMLFLLAATAAVI